MDGLTCSLHFSHLQKDEFLIMWYQVVLVLFIARDRLQHRENLSAICESTRRVNENGRYHSMPCYAMQYPFRASSSAQSSILIEQVVEIIIVPSALSSLNCDLLSLLLLITDSVQNILQLRF